MTAAKISARTLSGATFACVANTYPTFTIVLPGSYSASSLSPRGKEGGGARLEEDARSSVDTRNARRAGLTVRSGVADVSRVKKGC